MHLDDVIAERRAAGRGPSWVCRRVARTVHLGDNLSERGSADRGRRGASSPRPTRRPGRAAPPPPRRRGPSSDPRPRPAAAPPRPYGATDCAATAHEFWVGSGSLTFQREAMRTRAPVAVSICSWPLFGSDVTTGPV
ncbi:unannotated protein [freshwater metagenome]|uniref:Unannotated protein n=1 Tax=freshwater metagenome TaxID=449393 RepID=A0A6J7L385_9ZZZZ